MSKARTVRVRGSSQQWSAVVQRYESSGLTQAEFCRRHGIALSSLQRWRQRTRPSRAAAEFVELLPASDATTPVPSKWSLEVLLPSGAALRFQG